MAQIFFRKGCSGVVPSAWVIRPAQPEDGAPVVAVHGLNREAELMAQMLAVRADTTGRSIILPLFDRPSWPRFQRAACAQRSDWALLALLRSLRAQGWIGSEAPDLSGFSGGAQFAHRFAWLYPSLVSRLCLAAPGWWTFPDARGVFPLGLATASPAADGAGSTAATFRLRANLARFLDREITVTVGALDVAQDRTLRQDPEIMAQQGPNRVERARAWARAAQRAATAQGLIPRITFRIMENSNHSFADCVANGALAQSFVPAPRRSSPAMPISGHANLVEVA